MKVIYETTIKFTIVHEIDDMKNLKGGYEYAENISNLVADEVATCNGACIYDIQSALIDVR